jgi:hypothetical protein
MTWCPNIAHSARAPGFHVPAAGDHEHALAVLEKETASGFCSVSRHARGRIEIASPGKRVARQ